VACQIEFSTLLELLEDGSEHYRKDRKIKTEDFGLICLTNGNKKRLVEYSAGMKNESGYSYQVKVILSFQPSVI
jgi:hypothetical protein